jgi:hypothetical protein
MITFIKVTMWQAVLPYPLSLLLPLNPGTIIPQLAKAPATTNLNLKRRQISRDARLVMLLNLLHAAICQHKLQLAISGLVKLTLSALHY